MLPITSQPSPALKRLYGMPGLAVLAALYLLVGLVGHDPWRGDDALYFGPVFAMLQGEALLFPHLAGQPLADFPPLYYWTAATLAWSFSWLLPLHDGARLASALFTALTLYWIMRAAHQLHGRETRSAAALLTLGTLGLVIHAHQTQPMLALIAMQALTLAGLARVAQAPLGGALQAGLGLGLAFLAGGLSGVMLTLPLFLLILLGCPACRTPRTSGALLLGACLGLLLTTPWPLAVHASTPELFQLWWTREWAALSGKALQAATFGGLVEESGWFVWPLWPIALWALWAGRRRLGTLPMLLPLAATALAAGWVALQVVDTPVALLPMIPPLALLAAAGIPSLRRGAANAFDWFGVMTFAIFALLVWLAWTAQVFAWPPGLARHVERHGPDFVLQGETLQAVLGVLICVVWLVLAWRLPRTPSRGPANWAMGMTMLWCLAVTLLMPWFQHGRSYRPAAESLARAVTDKADECIATTGLSGGVRASLDYFAGIRPLSVRTQGSPCRLLLVHEDRRASTRPIAEEWTPIWEYQRGGERQRETFRLYRRD